MEADWQLRGESQELDASDFHPLIWRILQARGFTTSDSVRQFLAPSLKDLRDPSTIIDMPKAVERLIRAYENQEQICIYADYDLDGTSACALLLRGLSDLGFLKVQYYQPSRLKEGYGLKSEAIESLAKNGVQLILTVDLGITAVEEVETARRLGVDVIVTDHHLPGETLPRALAVVNPNRIECRAELGHLCGTGVAFYLMLALKREFEQRGWLKIPIDLKDLLDCFVIGTLTDMVPLIAENRVLIKHGLLALARTSRPGLRALLMEVGLWGLPLTSQDVGIRFAPKLNALSRMETGPQPIDLYLAQTENEAQSLMTQVMGLNQQRVSLQKQAERASLEYFQNSPPVGCAMIASSEFHKGILGLVATKICQLYSVPSFVGTITGEGEIVGSARAPFGFNLLDAFQAAGDALKQGGGHAQAAGFTLLEKNWQPFTERLQAYYLNRGIDEHRPPRLYDVEARLEHFDPPLMKWLEHLGPFGTQFEAPVFRLNQVELAGLREMSGGHLRLQLEQNGTRLNGIWFSPPPQTREKLMSSLRQPIDLLVEPQWNYYQGEKSIQLMVQDVQVSNHNYLGSASEKTTERPNDARQ